MNSKMLLKLSAGAALALMSLQPSAAFAQFPPPPPIAAGGPPPIAAGGPPAFAGRPPMGPGGAPLAGLAGAAPRLQAGSPGPRGDLRAAGELPGGRAVANSARVASASYSRSGSYGYRYGGSRYGYRAAYTAGAYAAGAYAGYAYGRSSYGYAADSDCYYVYRRYRRVLVCE
jgi:hypothetical protein